MNPPGQSGKVPKPKGVYDTASSADDATAKRRRVASYDRPDNPAGTKAGISPVILIGLVVLVLIILLAAYLLLFAGK